MDDEHPYLTSLINDTCEYLDDGDCCHPEEDASKGIQRPSQKYCLTKCTKRKMPIQEMALKLLADLAIEAGRMGIIAEEKLGSNTEENIEEFKQLDLLAHKLQQVDEFLGVLQLKKKETESVLQGHSA